MVADCIFEILSTITIFDDSLRIHLFDLSWDHLHTVYVHTDESDEEAPMLSCPFAVALSLTEQARQSHSMDQRSIKRIVHSIISTFLTRVSCYDSHSRYMHMGTMRHWGILTASGDVGFPFLILHLSMLVTNLNDFLESLDASITRKAKILERDEVGTSCKKARMKKSSKEPCIVGLEAATFPEFFETLLNLVIATTGTLALDQPTKICSTNNSQRVIEFFAIFRNLIDTYKDHISLFPFKSALLICSGSKYLLLVAVRQLQRCVEWPLEQSLTETGAVSHLQKFLESILSYTTAPLLSLCDVWQTSTKIIKRSKLSSLRLAVEKAAGKIKDISQSSNTFFEVTRGTSQVRGNTGGCRASPSIVTNKGQSDFLLFENHGETDQTVGNVHRKDDDCEDNDSSFGVMGNWGDGAKTDGDNDSICSLNIENPGPSIVHQNHNLHLVSR